MYFLFIVIAAVITRVDVVLCKRKIDEPVCTSRYDFESSLLRDMLKLELDMSVLKQNIDEDIANVEKETKLATEKLETATHQLEESQEQSLLAMNEQVDKKINELEATKALLQEEIITRLSSLEQQAEATLEEVRAASIKRPVVFLVKTLPDTTVVKNKVLKFTESIWNINNDYNSSTGYFTVPVNGTYMFHLQLCIQTNKYVNVQMVADDVVFATAVLHGSGSNAWSCYTVSGVAFLAQGGRVCSKIGNGYSSTGNTLYQNDVDRWASFMGTLVN